MRTQPSPPTAPPRRLEQIEYERVCADLLPVVTEKLASVSILVPEPQASLVLMAALFQQAVDLAQALGMNQIDFEKRAKAIIDRAYKPKPAVVEKPKIIL